MAHDTNRPPPSRGPAGLDAVPLACIADLSALRLLVAHLHFAGFEPPPRLVFALEQSRLTALTNALLRIMEVEVTVEAPSSTELPRALGTLRLGEGEDSDLELVGLPVADVFSPSWGLVVPGAAAVVQLKGVNSRILEEHCNLVEVPLLRAEDLVQAGDVEGPAQVIALIRASLEAVSAR